jgi:UDP-3-O-[3-hydroxymyristoyl] glucosamine N-acyltransferase
VPGHLAAVRADDPEGAFETVIDALHPEPQPAEGIHPRAVIAENVVLGENVRIGAYVVIDPDVEIGPGTRIDPGVYIGRGVWLGADCVIHAHVVICHGSILGNRVVIHPGTVIGSDGFGYRPVGGRPGWSGAWKKNRQVGNVVIEDDVEIGALATINRARLDSTRIGRGVKIDSNVHVAHNCTIGEGTALAGKTGLAGSVTIGKGCLVGGLVGITGHISIADGTILMGRSAVTRDIREADTYVGYPALPYREFLRRRRSLKKVPKLLARIEALEEKVRELE